MRACTLLRSLRLPDAGCGDGGTGQPTTTTLTLPPDPSLLEVTASSSAAGGPLGSPSLLFAQSWAPAGSAGQCFISNCLRNLFKDLAIAQVGMSSANDDPSYRFIDGGFVENTAIASTLAKVMSDHPTDSHLGKFIHFDLDVTFGENRAQALFSIPGETCNTPGGLCLDSFAPGQHNANNVGRPVSTIFSNTWPTEDEWTEYTSWTDKDGLSVSSYYWRGHVTTIENRFYGVQAGKTLELLVFSLNHPSADLIIAGGHVGADLWGSVYGPIAAAQAQGATPVITAFLAD